MNTHRVTRIGGGISIILLAAGCSTWDSMNRTQQGTTVGASSGAVAGAVVAGPVGAVVGGVAGGAVGYGAAKSYDSGVRNSESPNTTSRSTLVQSAQQSLNEKGFDAGAPDGRVAPGAGFHGGHRDGGVRQEAASEHAVGAAAAEDGEVLGVEDGVAVQQEAAFQRLHARGEGPPAAGATPEPARPIAHEVGNGAHGEFPYLERGGVVAQKERTTNGLGRIAERSTHRTPPSPRK